ncbi:uncharacterized protein LOC134828919 [Culicoides brevitarsis]|uniref:uncharacterized protein LOC134828919 n=1 Tax=Culicoides brevitarsis TaxID=469753 RepID=UPI00307BF3C3
MLPRANSSSESSSSRRVAAALPNYPVINTSSSSRHEGVALGDRGSAAVRLDFRTRRNIQRNILPDLVCDSVLSGFRRYNATQRTSSAPPVVSTEPVQEPEAAPVEPEIKNPEPEMGQRISHPQKPNISFAWVLRGGDPNSSSSSTTSSSSCSSSVYQNSSVSRSFTWDHPHHKRRIRNAQCKSRKHHLFNEKNLKANDLDDYRIVRKNLLETSEKLNNNYNETLDFECLSLSTAETTTSISKCVDKATNLKKKRYRSKSRSRLETTGCDEFSTKSVAKEIPDSNCDTSAFDEYLKKCSLLCPANLPMVLVSDTIMYQTRIGYQSEIFLPLGTLIKGIFKVHDWIYVQLPGKIDHSGYVTASSCIPMGIVPKKHQSLHRPPRQALQNARITSKSTDNLNLLLKPRNSMQKSENAMTGTQFEALYARVIDKLRTNLEESEANKYSLSAQNLEKFNVLSNEAIQKQENIKI